MPPCAERARLYRLLARPLHQSGQEDWDDLCSGSWAGEVQAALEALGIPLTAPRELCPRTVEQAEREHYQAFVAPGRSLKPIESVHKPWTTDPEAELPIAHQKGWLGGDPSAHLQTLYESCGIGIPDELAHAPDHLALELEVMALLIEQGTPESASLFRSQHLDWVQEFAAEAAGAEVSAFYRALAALTAAFIAADGQGAPAR